MEIKSETSMTVVKMELGGYVVLSDDNMQFSRKPLYATDNINNALAFIKKAIECKDGEAT